ncbi:hypothetical protein BP00DRAFT_451697 [Aspergillus indologenus CBS 114.80]|uniref:Zn(2)-C6 fungal-type domain-containing protein n=1 Tax=Aspergillus indologenus CBS 114.80 TaxID=1450541 RepID=A0A2V5HUS6_9EURO|nr:hypothetical protein BP00DRAFT_451697 [Aspergillus indologenus CBS 114.80]
MATSTASAQSCVRCKGTVDTPCQTCQKPRAQCDPAPPKIRFRSVPRRRQTFDFAPNQTWVQSKKRRRLTYVDMTPHVARDRATFDTDECRNTRDASAFPLIQSLLHVSSANGMTVDLHPQQLRKNDTKQGCCSIVFLFGGAHKHAISIPNGHTGRIREEQISARAPARAANFTFRRCIPEPRGGLFATAFYPESGSVGTRITGYQQ